MTDRLSPSVIIIGAGVIGAAVAEALTRRGASVTVLDMRSTGRGASQASAGILAPYIEAHDEGPLLELGTRSLALYDDVIARVCEASGHDVPYARTGTIEVALDEADSARLQEHAQRLAARGVAARWLDAADVRAGYAHVTPSARGALFIDTHGFVDPIAFVRALAQAAKFGGAEFVSPIEAASVALRADGVDVRAGDRTYHADAAVIAAGSWSRRVRVEGVAPLPVRPVRGQLLHLEWPEGPAGGPVIWGRRCYVVPRADGSTLAGATVEEAGFDERSTAAGVSELLSATLELLPAARDASVSEVRVGLRPALPDGLPAIGPFRGADRVVAATGHYRNGILLAPVTAEIVADYLISGRLDAVFPAVSPDRFQLA